MPVSDEVPAGFELRAASLDYAPAIAEIVNAVMLADSGQPWTTAEETRDVLTSPGRDPELADVVLVETGGEPIGYLQFSADAASPSPVVMFPYVRPRLWGRGLNTWLLRLGEERVAARTRPHTPGEAVVLHVARFTDNEPARRLFTELGYGYARTFWMMQIDLDAAPPDARAPAGIVIRTFEPGRDERPLHAALAEGFLDHWGGPFPAFEEWRHLHLEGDGAGFDPSLCFLATDDAEIVAAAYCLASTPRSEDTAEVAQLAVRRPWRRRGVALALLHTAFAEFRRRGIPRAELGVDADSPTGATHLYERAGMRSAYSWEFWEKELPTF